MKRLVLALLGLLFASPSIAEPSHQFLLVGHIESFTIDDPTDPLSPARIKVHGTEVILPRNLIIQMPARYLTAADILTLAPATVTAGTGLALADTPPPVAAMEATVVGNIVGNDYIAGLVWITQHALAEGAGYIKDIGVDGEIHLVANPDPAAPAQPITRLRINDPNGVFAPPDPLADPRFMVDEANPTIHAGTGYPMCIPQADTVAEPQLSNECPTANRPVVAGKPLTTFVMGDNPLPGSPAGAPPIPACPGCDPFRQAPLMPGDYIIYAGTLALDGTDIYISAHTIDANVGIYTAPGENPAYVLIEGSLIGAQGPLVQRPGFPLGTTLPQETQDRLKIEGVTTDPSRRIALYAIDVDPVTGAQVLRLFNTVPAQPAPLGRFRLILGARANALFDENGLQKGAARELMARVERGPVPDYSDPPIDLVAGAPSQLANLNGAVVPTGPVAAHGLVAGQYVAPFGEFIFPENKLIGDPIIANNFECLPFLSYGSGPLTTLGLTTPPLVGQLMPWPGETAPPAAPGAPWEVACGPRPKPLL